MKNDSENGINEGLIPEKTIITHINGIALNLSELKIKEFVATYISPQPGDKLILTSVEGNNYTINTDKIPVISVYVGILPKSYWLPKNWLGELFGSSFPNWLELEVSLTFMISFSVALFNLLPVSVFDGGRLVKELIQIFIGTEYKPETKKKLRYEYNPKDGKIQPLMIHDIKQVISVNEIILNDNSEKKEQSQNFSLKPIRFIPIDSYKTGIIDSIEIYEEDIPKKKSILEIEFDYDLDVKVIRKKRIISIISWTIGIIILLNFILSLTKLGTGIFWL